MNSYGVGEAPADEAAAKLECTDPDKGKIGVGWLTIRSEQIRLSKHWFIWISWLFCVGNTANAEVISNNMNRVFIITPNVGRFADIPTAGVYNSLATFAKATGCLLPGDHILIEGGKEYQGSLHLSGCDGVSTSNGQVVVRSFHPDWPLDESREVSNAIIRAAPSASELNLKLQLVSKVSFRGKPVPHLTGRTLYKIGTFKNRVTQVFYDDERLPLARYPDYASSASVSNYVPLAEAQQEGDRCSSKTCLSFSHADTINILAKLKAVEERGMSEAYVVVRNSPWSLAKARIREASTKGDVELDEALHGVGRATQSLPTPGHGVVFLNSFAFLDNVGEWFFSSDDGNVYLLWDKNNNAPLASKLRFSLDESQGSDKLHFDNAGLAYWGRSTPGKVDSIQHLKIRGVSVWQSAGSGIRVRNIRNVEILGASVRSSVGNGIIVGNIANKSRISGARIEGAGGTGISATATTIVEISDNMIKDSGYIGTQEQMEMNFSGINMNPGFLDAKITSNFIRGTGYAGIVVSEPPQDAIGKFKEMAIQISNNEISRFCQLLNDCGGIYINGQLRDISKSFEGTRSKKYISANIISDPRPNMDGTPSRFNFDSLNKKPMGDWQELVAAIYLDRKASYYEVYTNRISGHYKPYSWMIRGGGLFNACGSENINRCKSAANSPMSEYKCYTQQLDKCNAVSD